MIITDTEQEKLLDDWLLNTPHNTPPDIGAFISGMNAAFDIVDQKLKHENLVNS